MPYNKEKFDNIVKICSLKRDFSILEHGDMTEIGTKPFPPSEPPA